MPDKPIIYLAFSNSPANPLEALKKELNQIQTIFENQVLRDLFEIKVRMESSLDEIIQTFRNFRDRIVIFHYAGHADDYSLLLKVGKEEKSVDSRGLTPFFEGASKLKLVFLNGCATEKQAEDLQSFVPFVVATSREIDDVWASRFAVNFYRSLAANASIGQAFRESEGVLGAEHGSETVRGLHLRSKGGQPAWQLHFNPEKGIPPDTEFLDYVEYEFAGTSKDFVRITPSFWEERKKKDTEDLFSYYTRIDSLKSRLFEVVANDLYEPNDGAFEVVRENGQKEKRTLDEILGEATIGQPALIKVLSQGGEGKSTFLVHLARKHCEKYAVFYWKEVSKESIGAMLDGLRFSTRDKVLLLLDDAEKQSERLIGLIDRLVEGLRTKTVVLVLAERAFRYEHLEDIVDFERHFPRRFGLTYRLSAGSAGKILEILTRELLGGRKLPANKKAGLQLAFKNSNNPRDRYRSIVDRMLSAIRYLKEEGELPDYRYDWQDWDQFIARNPQYAGLHRLYLVVAAFFQFGNIPTVPFCLANKWIAGDQLDVEEALNQNPASPIFLSGNYKRSFLNLRHETLARWYIEKEKKERAVREIYEDLFRNVNDEFSKDLFLWTYRNPEFQQTDYLQGLISDNEVMEVLAKFIKDHPKELKSRTELAKIYQKQGDLENAIEYLRQYIALDAKGLHPRTELAKIYQKQGDLENAESILLELLRLDPNNLQARTELAKIFREKGELRRAIEYLEQYIALDPKGLHPRTELAKIYREEGNLHESEEVLLELLKLDPNNLQARTELAKTYQKQGNYPEAKQILLDLLRLDSNNFQARTELAKVYQKQGDFFEAEEKLLELLKLDPNNLQARTELAKIYQKLGGLEQATRYLEQYITLDPKGLHPRTELAKIYQELRDYTKAIEYLEQHITLDPKAIHPRTELGKVYQQQGEWGKAEAILQEAIDLDPKAIHPRTELGIVYRRQHHLDNAENVLREAVDIDESSKHARTELAIVLQLKGELQKAEQLLKEVLEIEPTNLHALGLLSRLYSEQRRFPEREDLLFQVYQSHPTNIPTIQGLAKVFIRFRKYHIAWRLLEKSHRIESDNLCLVVELMRISNIFRDRQGFASWKKVGQKILEENARSKCKLRFERTLFEASPIFSFEDLGEVGIFDRSGPAVVDQTGMRIPVIQGGAVNNRLEDGQKVFFAKYSLKKDNSAWADFIEPYFENLDDLKALK